MKILLVEDDCLILGFLEKGLKEAGYVTDKASDGDDALYLTKVNRYDLIILDIMLPGQSGLQVCQKLRERGDVTPIILLTARDSLEDKIVGLDVGANDYLTKPFSFDELLARIRVQLRDKKNPLDRFEIEDFVIDFAAKKIIRSGVAIGLTLKEFQLLAFLVRQRNHIVSETMIVETLSDMDQTRMSNIVSVYIYRLRNKIDKGHEIKLIHTFRGLGYQFGVGDV